MKYILDGLAFIGGGTVGFALLLTCMYFLGKFSGYCIYGTDGGMLCVIGLR